MSRIPRGEIRFTWISRSHDKKTGPIPAAYCGQSIEEMKGTCTGCALRDRICYAWKGTPKLGFGAMARVATEGRTAFDMRDTPATRPGGRYALDSALQNRHPKARAVRIGMLGDSSRVTRRVFWRTVRTIRRAGLTILNYTHFWREYRNRSLRRAAMASCDTLADADDAIGTGWVPAAIVPGTDHHDIDPTIATVDTPAGNPLLVCPAQRTANRITCNACRLCDPGNPFWVRQDRVRGIAFYQH